MESITIVEGDRGDPQHQDANIHLVDGYSRAPMGGGKALPEEVHMGLIPGLQRHPTTLVFLAWHSTTPVGIAICFIGFSTFLARPLINIHDVAVLPTYRSQGVGRRLLEQVAAKGKALGCCKLTLEVRADNYPAQRLYEAVGSDNAASYGGAVQVWFLEKRL